MSENDLFNENNLKNMFSNLSDEDKKKYQRIGEEMYNIDYEKINEQGKIEQDKADNIELENVSQIKLMLCSGLHPSFLSSQEKDMMKNNYGNKWIESYGYLEIDLNRINF